MTRAGALDEEGRGELGISIAARDPRQMGLRERHTLAVAKVSHESAGTRHRATWRVAVSPA